MTALAGTPVGSGEDQPGVDPGGAGVDAARTTPDALESLAGGGEGLDPALVIRLARATLFVVTATG